MYTPARFLVVTLATTVNPQHHENPRVFAWDLPVRFWYRMPIALGELLLEGWVGWGGGFVVSRQSVDFVVFIYYVILLIRSKLEWFRV